jgi:hypothetical protein
LNVKQQIQQILTVDSGAIMGLTSFLPIGIIAVQKQWNCGTPAKKGEK